MVYVYSSVMLRRGSYRKFFCTVYAQQQLHYDTDQELYTLATLQQLTLVWAHLVIDIMLCYFWEVTLCLTRGMTTL